MKSGRNSEVATHDNDIDLTPRAEFVAQTGGQVKYPSITAGEYLQQRLTEIGLKK